MGLINDFLAFIIDRKLKVDGEVEKPTVPQSCFTNEQVLDALMKMDTVIGDMDKRITELERRVKLPSNR